MTELERLKKELAKAQAKSLKAAAARDRIQEKIEQLEAKP